MADNEKYLVYENWQAARKAVVHKSSCGHANVGNTRLNDHTAPNDRWFGYFETLSEAIAFAVLFPNRQFKMCGVCLGDEKQAI